MSDHGETTARWWRRPGIVTLLPAAIVLIVYVVNLQKSYDFSLDEITYTTVSQRVIGDNAIATASRPFLVHPPFYFLLAGLWDLVTGHRDSDTLAALRSLRYLQAVLVAVAAWVVGLVTTAAIRSAGVRVRTWMPTLAMAIFAFSSFVLSFGRAVLLETGAVLASGLVVLVALRVRTRPALVQICALGALIGVGCLVKQTVIFAGAAPLLASLVRREWRAAATQLGAVAVGGLVWSSFFVWSVTQGHGRDFLDQESVSLRRLFGVLHTSGVNKPNRPAGTAGPLDDIKATYVQYLAGYLVFAAGALALLVLVARRRLFARTDRLPFAHHLVLCFGVLDYAFVAFSFAFGQGNEQLIMYSAPPAAIATVYAVVVVGGAERRRGFAGVMRPVLALVALAGIVVGAGTWGYYYVAHDDDGTARMASYVSRTTPGCVAINASGNSERWRAVLPDANVTGYDDGRRAVARGTRLFVVSSKDASHAYGNMSPQFAVWAKRYGTLVHSVDSRSYGTISLYRVGAASAVRADPAVCRTAAAARATRITHTAASALVYYSILAGALVVVGGVGVVTARRSSAPGRRRG
ncbi:Protein of unknown function [Jatrophihabitans endophyticus]|uniref:Dolichyl-phosphate-mannose-protein mannosyltransferase n=1 Tax=Jatrophihabitans endophyticus TaxID=1206085 RepID=A0A1M5IKQ4_9ACTN|nr:glycosyltransferase family 87 protein [Jatrophihabitans endophyticus]SHG28851.1 Protein of unknown function [Jatrophihabitans endophyticus]